MKAFLLCAVIVTGTALIGCASKTSTSYELWVIPPLGQVTTRSTGESLIEQGFSQVGPEIEILNEVSIGQKKLPKGRYPYYSENRKGIWFYKGDYFFYLNKSDNLVCMGGNDCTKIDYAMGKARIPGTARMDSFQQTLIYNGKIGNRITLAYREFQNSLARPAFNNSAEYDLSESNVLGYKGARLEVIQATNSEITYRVLSEFRR